MTISIHALRGEGDSGLKSSFESELISIHALRGEGDLFAGFLCHSSRNFNPRPPWGGRPRYSYDCIFVDSYFNPRPPWGGRHNSSSFLKAAVYFNPRPPWGGRRGEETRGRRGRDISIHALRGEGDANIIKAGIMQSVFQSTPSVGRATRAAVLSAISTAFQSTPSVGRATAIRRGLRTIGIFQSTPSVGRATFVHFFSGISIIISIHALRGEGDRQCQVSF